VQDFKVAWGCNNAEEEQMKKLSIITICYNEPNLETTCESIVNQTLQDFEWVVVDGGSNQETLDIFEKYKHRINKFISEPDNGIYNAMNKGIKLAEGEYLLFINAGDSLHSPEVLNSVVKNGITKDIVYGNSWYIKNKTEQFKVIPPDVLTSDFWIVSNINQQAMFIKKELFKKYGLFDESYKILADWERWINFIYINKCSYEHLNLIIADYDVNGISSSPKSVITCKEEKERFRHKYFSQQEIELALSRIKQKYSFLEQIFSVKNNCYKTHKIITILGIHIKMRNKQKGR
jgi:glycosyltransferase involved in cell wall biosynthesis